MEKEKAGKGAFQTQYYGVIANDISRAPAPFRPGAREANKQRAAFSTQAAESSSMLNILAARLDAEESGAKVMQELYAVRSSARRVERSEDMQQGHNLNAAKHSH
mmetsp:Transcript_33575/g.85955  ORF Transcript_33575/g.85955 Transcript_33575/m.85955 type:complete len:105 (+) Transcript_33575:1889-2203(+)